jgi:FlaA1/EpsC-like NDP-sugar epimerase
VQTDVAAVGGLITGKRVLITGGGGSIGSELCRQVWRCKPEHLILLGHGENSIFEIYHELLRLGATPEQVTAVIADVRFPDRLQIVFEEARPDIVFHAAAHKHVPLMEMNPAEAITNNVVGTRNLLKAALAVGVERFVMISTDKAVNPTNVMGASKRTAELLVHQAAQQSGKAYVAVRFGNVLGSRGSVVLTFKQQIAQGGPVTVTDSEMTRYFMTIPEAVQLVLQAAVLGSGGEVFVLDMGEPVKIVDLARDLIELSGLEVGRDIDIVYSGLRPGEKLFEELFLDGEDYQRTRHEKIFTAANANTLSSDDLEAGLSALQASAARNDRKGIIRGLQNLVPEFEPMVPLEAMKVVKSVKDDSGSTQVKALPLAPSHGKGR